MKFFLSLLSVVMFFSCSKNSNPAPDNTPGQNVSVLVQPNQTDGNYAAADQSHYVVRNTKTHLNKLLLFIGGSFSVPKDYYDVCDYGATIGLDAISLSYPNNVGTAPLGTSSDSLIFDKYRDEICFGNPVSAVIDVDVLNCISTRATKLIVFLKTAYPDQNWGQYLTATNSIEWSKVIVAGHSQGSGHACYLGKKKLVDRVVMFSGPNDYSMYYSSAGHWLSVAGLTPTTKHFSLLHTQDEIVSFSNQVANTRALGLLGANENPLAADNLPTPYSNAHSLSINFTSVSNHASTIGKNAKLPAIWSYMFTAN
jgi:hypothetical protein